MKISKILSLYEKSFLTKHEGLQKALNLDQQNICSLDSFFVNWEFLGR